MLVRSATDTDRFKWDAFVSAHEQSSPYHLWAWKAAVEKAYGHRGHYLIAEEYGEVAGVLPMVLMEFPLIYRQAVSLPFCDVGGILAANAEAGRQLVTEALAHCRNIKAGSLELRSHDEAAPLPAEEHCTARSDKVSMLLQLPAGSENLWDGFKSKLRSQIRKAEKNGLVFKWGEKEDRDDFYAVFSRNMRELGSPVHSRCWIAAVLDNFGANARMGLVCKDELPIGAGIILSNGKTVSIPWASTLRDYNQLSPNMLLYWNFLRYAADSGHGCFDFGRSTFGEGTYKFKAQWGAEPKRLHWHTVHFAARPRESGIADGTPGHDRQRLALLWSKLPLFAANLFGPLLRRHVSL